MNNAKDHTTAADAADQSAGGPPTIGVGVSIGIGAGLGMVVGILVGDMVRGMLYGAGLGTVVGAVRETLRRRVDGTPPPRAGRDARTTWWRSLLERHALLAFFGLTFALSWSLWGLQALRAAADPISARWLGISATYGPTLAAIALAGLLRPGRQPTAWSSRQRWLAGAVLVGTVGLNITIASNPLTSTRPLVAALLWLVITLLPAWLVWNSFSRRLGVRALLHTLASWRAPPIWYLTALLLPVLISVAGLALLALLGQPLPPFPRTEPLQTLLPLLVITFVATMLYGGPLGEEVGWRGFALPRLQLRYSPLVASLLLSVVWGLWHVPLHLMGVYHGIFPDGLPGIVLRIVTTLPTTVLFTWFYNRTKGNLWLVVLLHTAVNNSAGFWLPITPGVYATMSITTVTLIITDRMWRVRPPERVLARAEGPLEPLARS